MAEQEWWNGNGIKSKELDDSHAFTKSQLAELESLRAQLAERDAEIAVLKIAHEAHQTSNLRMLAKLKELAFADKEHKEEIERKMQAGQFVLEQLTTAQQTIESQAAQIEALREACKDISQLINYQFTGSSEGMTAFQDACDACFEALATTPATALAEHDALLVERIAESVDTYGRNAKASMAEEVEADDPSVWVTCEELADKIRKGEFV